MNPLFFSQLDSRREPGGVLVCRLAISIETNSVRFSESKSGTRAAFELDTSLFLEN